jgi:carnitine O-acetyltransferase
MASLSTSAARRGARTFATATQTRVKTFDNQSRVPHLPIPQLETETMPLLMKTLRPLAWTDAEWKAVQTKAADFVAPGGMGEKLQKRLVDFGAERTKRDGSWLDDLWLHKAYVEYRDSSVCNVSYYMT